MATDFPTGLDALTNPTATDYLNSPSHAGQHANANDAIEALEAKVGINSSAVTTSHDYKLSLVTGIAKALPDSYLDTDGTLAANSDTKIATQKATKTYVDSNGGGYNEGFMNNGKIVVTVASNNITVALKTLAGNDPSTGDPVKIRINGVVRTITSALSVTKNSGTNWCNSGSAELATKEVDYFAYLGYNATDGVVIGFSRIPYGALYSDFSATATNEKYCAISTITNATASDVYTNIGRFAATLSAGAGYTWSVPTFTATNLVQRPIYETRLLDYVLGISSWTNPPTSQTKVGKYKIIGRSCVTHQLVRGTQNASNSSTLVVLTLPFGLTDYGVHSRGNGLTVAQWTDNTNFDELATVRKDLTLPNTFYIQFATATRRPNLLMSSATYEI